LERKTDRKKERKKGRRERKKVKIGIPLWKQKIKDSISKKSFNFEKTRFCISCPRKKRHKK
jgi:hypothetical protein